MTQLSLPRLFAATVLGLASGDGLRTRIERLDSESGERRYWQSLRLTDARGVVFVSSPVVAAGGSCYGYSYLRIVSNLCLVESLSA